MSFLNFLNRQIQKPENSSGLLNGGTVSARVLTLVQQAHSRYRPSHSASSIEPHVAVCIHINDYLPHEEIWKHWFDSAEYENVVMYFYSDHPHAIKSNWVRDRLIDCSSSSRDHAVNSLKSTLILLDGAYQSSFNADIFILLTHKMIPIRPFQDFLRLYRDRQHANALSRGIYSENHPLISLMEWTGIPLERDEKRIFFDAIETSLIPSCAVKRSYGLPILSRPHVEDILVNLKKKVGNDLTSAWRGTFHLEETYFATVLGLFGHLRKMESLKQEMHDVIPETLTYMHIQDPIRDTGRTEDISTFDMVTKHMFDEFRHNESHIFAASFSENAISLADWCTYCYRTDPALTYDIIPPLVHPIPSTSTIPIDSTDIENEEDEVIKHAAKRLKTSHTEESSISEEEANVNVDLNVVTKIVINSNSNYRRALSLLLQSILESDFLGVHNKTTRDIIVVISQSREDSEPQYLPLSAVADITYPSSYSTQDLQVCVIYARMNNFDWTAFHQLNRYLHHPLIRADKYLHMLDTCKVMPTFWTCFNRLFYSCIHYTDENLILIPNKPHSNICIIGRGVVEKYGDNFESSITKAQTVMLECDEHPVLGYFTPENNNNKNLNPKRNKYRRLMFGITAFGNVVRFPHGREAVMTKSSSKSKEILELEEDWYGTGYPRKIYLYPDLGIYKSILWHKNGDFTGNVEINFEYKVLAKKY